MRAPLLRPPVARHGLGPALLATLLIGLLASAPADARRVGGGRSSGMSRSLTLDETPIRPVAVRGATLHNANVQAPQSAAFPLADIGRESAFLIRRAQLESQLEARHQRLMMAQRKASGSDGGSAAEASAAPLPNPAANPPAQAPVATEPSARPARSADSDFNRFTAIPVVTTTCEIKPVMRDDDYIACGATPPESPMGNRR